jgi:anti-anti-sigma factor
MVELFSITVREVQGALVFELGGEFDLSGRLTFEELVVGPPGSLLVLDLSGLTFIDSSGLGAIHRAKKIAEKDGGHMRICRPRPPVHRLFEISGLLGWLSEWDPTWSSEISGNARTSDVPE